VSHALYGLLSRLETAGIFFTLCRHRSDSVLVSLTLVGEPYPFLGYELHE
jgi:hypothetical protein